MNKVRRISHAGIALAFIALISSGNFLGEVYSLLLQQEGTVPLLSSADSSSSTPTDHPHELLSSPLTRRSALSTAAWSLVIGESALTGNPSLSSAAEEDSFVYTRKQTVMNKKELSYQISIPSTMNEGSKPVKTHLDEVNFFSESVKRYQYGITVDPVRISSLKEVSANPTEAFLFANMMLHRGYASYEILIFIEHLFLGPERVSRLY